MVRSAVEGHLEEVFHPHHLQRLPPGHGDGLELLLEPQQIRTVVVRGDGLIGVGLAEHGQLRNAENSFFKSGAMSLTRGPLADARGSGPFDRARGSKRF